MTLDPSDYTIQELGPEIQDVEDVEELREILEKEREGEDRTGAVQLIESRIEKFEDEGDEEEGGIDLEELSVAEIANAVRDVDDVEELEALLEAEEAGQDRDSVKKQISNRIDSVQGSDEEEVEAELPPEEKHPDLDHPTADKKYVRALEGGVYRDMWVYCETQRGELIDVSREMLGKAREMMDDYADEYGGSASSDGPEVSRAARAAEPREDDASGASEDGQSESSGDEERVVAVLVGDDVERLADECISYGADVVVYTEDSRLERFQHTAYTEVFCDMARGAGHPHGREDRQEEEWRDYDEPRYVLFPATNNGRDLSAQVQAELDSGLASDCSGLYIENNVISNPAKVRREGEKKEFERVLHMKRPDFSGFEYSTILCLDNPNREFHPQGASVIPGSFEVPDPDPEREGEVVEHDLDLEDEWFRVEITDHDELDPGVDLTGHDVIVALGRGIGDDPTRGMELGLELVDAFEDADLGITRGIVTSSYDFEGHVEQYSKEERQIGETGQVVEPDLYVAAGISGAVQHKVGMDESDTIVSINTDSEADIRDFSDYFIEGDLFEVLPRLTEALEEGELDLKAAADGGAAPEGGDD
jgi:electron transfer flavoprotein alpha subunit